jgi:hypothetical protein
MAPSDRAGSAGAIVCNDRSTRRSAGRPGVTLYRRLTMLTSLLMVGIGVAMLVITVGRGGGIGYVIGLLFLGLGAGRLYLLLRRR